LRERLRNLEKGGLIVHISANLAFSLSSTGRVVFMAILHSPPKEEFAPPNYFVYMNLLELVFHARRAKIQSLYFLSSHYNPWPIA